MSVQLIAWAYDQEVGSHTEKAVLLALANRASHDHHECYPSVALMAKETELGEATVRRALKALADKGFISRQRRRRADGSLGVYDYSFPLYHETARARTPALRESGRASAQSERAEPREDLEPGGLRPTSSTTDSDLGARAETPRTVDRKTVTTPEARQASDILERWNQATGQSLRAKEWLAKIIMRLREHPELNVGDHERLIAATLRDPWWKGAPSPSVLYGNGAIFEKQLAVAETPTGIEAFYAHARKAEEEMRRRHAV